MSGSISIFEIDNNEKLTRLIEQLIIQSNSTYVLKPNAITQIQSHEQIQSVIPKWPFWISRPWIIAGSAKDLPSDIKYSGPFIKGDNSTNFNQQVNTLLQYFDWAVSSYFTTYQSNIGCLITASSNPYQQTAAMVYGTDIELSCYETNPIQSLRTATFGDYDIEGVFAYELAKLNNEALPLLLCCISVDAEEEYLRWDDDADKYEEIPWYTNHLAQLNLVDEFITSDYKAKYLVFQVTNEEAYLDIWSQASRGYSIAKATLSANTDLKKLKSILSESYCFQITKRLDDCCDWSYAQVYGGGSDEHHAIFRSKDAKITEQLWQLVGQVKGHQISRF